MPIFNVNGRRILFVHVPKNAGTSISAMLEQLGEKRFDERLKVFGRTLRPRHLHAAVLEKLLFLEMLDYSFMIVRDPIEKLLSEYRYQRKKGGLHWQNFIGFDAWLRMSFFLADRFPEYRENHFRPQSDFECFGCEFFRIEDGLEPVADRLKVVAGLAFPPDVPRHNQSKNADIKPSSASLKRIAERYAKDFERFGYTLPSR